MIDAVMRALGMGLAMGWEILWPLILGFALSGVVQAAVSHQQMSQLLPDDRPRSIATALALGAAGRVSRIENLLWSYRLRLYRPLLGGS